MDDFALIDTLQNNKNDTSHVVKSYLQIPSFIEQKLSPFFFDPSKLYTIDLIGADVEKRNSLYDEPDNKTFNRLLQTVVHKKDTIARDYKNINVKDMNYYSATEFSKTFGKRLFEIASQIMTMTQISTRWSYKLKDLYVVRVFGIERDFDSKNNVFWINMEACVHKSDRVYGKSLTMNFFYDTRTKSVHVLECNLSGIIPQQYIKGVSEDDGAKRTKRTIIERSNPDTLADHPDTNEFHVIDKKDK